MNRVLQLHEIHNLTEDQRKEAGIHTRLERLAEVERATGADSHAFVITPTAFEEFARENDIGNPEQKVELGEIDESKLDSIGKKEEHLIQQSSIPQQTNQEIEALASRFDSGVQKRIETGHTSRCSDGYADVDELLETIKSAWTSLASKSRIFSRITADKPLHEDGDTVFVMESGSGRNSGTVRIDYERDYIELFVKPPGRTELPGSPGHRDFREVEEYHEVNAETGQITDVQFITGSESHNSELEPILRGREANRLIELAETVRKETSANRFGWVSAEYGNGIRLSPNSSGFSVEPPQEVIPDEVELAFPIVEGQQALGGSTVGNVVFLELEESNRAGGLGFDDLMEKVRDTEGPYVFIIDEVDLELLSVRTGAAVIAPNCRSLTGRAAVAGRQCGTPTVIDCDASELTKGDTVYVHDSGDVYAVS